MPANINCNNTGLVRFTNPAVQLIDMVVYIPLLSVVFIFQCIAGNGIASLCKRCSRQLATDHNQLKAFSMVFSATPADFMADFTVLSLKPAFFNALLMSLLPWFQTSFALSICAMSDDP